jgi:hypothetical protein
LSSLDCPWAVPVLVMSRERGSGIMHLSISQYSTVQYSTMGRLGSALIGMWDGVDQLCRSRFGFRFSSLVALESPDPAAGCRCFGL